VVPLRLRARRDGRDACTTETLKRVFKASGGNVRELLLALTQTDAFLYRQGGQP
jgi:hypothetical protein